MRRARPFAIVGIACGVAVIGASVVDCAEPTQIEIDVRSDTCVSVKNTAIAVAAPAEIEKAPYTIFTPRASGCESKPEDRIGTLVLYPRGSKDAEVSVRIVTGVTRQAQDCGENNYAGCIVARRNLKFVAGESQKVIVIMSRACVGLDCGPGGDCNQSGQCTSLGNDGGVSDSGPPASEAGSDAPVDAPIVDSGDPDACSRCSGVGQTCTGGNQCRINCLDANCNDAGSTLCAPGLNCTYDCVGANRCSNIVCDAPGQACSFNCSSGTNACRNISCTSATCSIDCNGPSSCVGVSMKGGDAGIRCLNGGGNDACNDVACDAGRCELVCSGNSCPSDKTCDQPPSLCVGAW